eukprot:5331836-Pyramimonas_sp.AAC.1
MALWSPTCEENVVVGAALSGGAERGGHHGVERLCRLFKARVDLRMWTQHREHHRTAASLALGIDLTVDHILPFGVQYFEYSPEYSACIPFRQSTTWLPDCRLRDSVLGVADVCIRMGESWINRDSVLLETQSEADSPIQ